MARIIVGMSGGVDSAAAACLLKMAGHEVIGLTLRTWTGGEESRCCEIGAAEQAARQLGIPYYVHSCAGDFRRWVTEPFIEAYLKGETPNPCLSCNRHVKWEGLFQAAAKMGAAWVATGHYARICRLPGGRYAVRKALHPEKDQSYMLSRLTQDQLERTLLPLGALTKDQVRALAKEAGLGAADRPDSQDICFARKGRYAEYIEENAREEIPDQGPFLDEEGRVLGTHKGIIHYTVGQRRGLGLSLKEPAYVKEICPKTGAVILGPETSLYKKEVLCRDPVFMGLAGLDPGETIRCRVRLRAGQRETGALAMSLGPDAFRLVFEEPVRAPAPGQAAVLYDGEGRVLASGILAGN